MHHQTGEQCNDGGKGRWYVSDCEHRISLEIGYGQYFPYCYEELTSPVPHSVTWLPIPAPMSRTNYPLDDFPDLDLN